MKLSDMLFANAMMGGGGGGGGGSSYPVAHVSVVLEGDGSNYIGFEGSHQQGSDYYVDGVIIGENNYIGFTWLIAPYNDSFDVLLLNDSVKIQVSPDFENNISLTGAAAWEYSEPDEGYLIFVSGDCTITITAS